MEGYEKQLFQKFKNLKVSFQTVYAHKYTSISIFKLDRISAWNKTKLENWVLYFNKIFVFKNDYYNWK